ncbi:MAG: TetR/AcrR family transcriptional regulator [Henriciella sp.]
MRKSDAEIALLDAAQELIAQQGITATSLAQIGERAGYSRGLINHHFGTKDALVARLATRAQDWFVNRAAKKSTASGRDTILAVIDAYLEVFFSGNVSARAFLVMWGASFPENASIEGLAENDVRARARFEEMIRSAQSDGSVNSEIDPKATATIMLGLIRGVAAQSVVAGRGLGRQKLKTQCRKFIESALS